MITGGAVGFSGSLRLFSGGWKHDRTARLALYPRNG